MWPTNLAKNLGKDDFKYLIQEFDIIVRDLVKQKGFYPYGYMSDFKKLKQKLPSILNGNNISEKEYILLLGDIFLEIIA